MFELKKTYLKYIFSVLTIFEYEPTNDDYDDDFIKNASEMHFISCAKVMRSESPMRIQNPLFHTTIKLVKLGVVTSVWEISRTEFGKLLNGFMPAN